MDECLTLAMPYNPFATTADGNANPNVHKLTTPRWPAVFNVPLTSLEWSTSETVSRKPSRVESDAEQSRTQHSQTTQLQNGTVATRPPKEAKQIIVEKIYAEPMTIMGVPPLADDRVRYVVNFMLEHVNSPNVEVEAKLGALIEKYQTTRAVDLVPVLCETPLKKESNADTRFHSDVSNEVFRILNEELNKRVEATAEQDIGRVQYLRTREIDVFWPDRIRETKIRRVDGAQREHEETVRVQAKRRLSDLNILCPGSVLDVRYSASLEEDAKVPPNAVPLRRRFKDRISYKFEYLSVDITAVEMQEGHHQEVTTTYEVEVEVDQTADLYREVCKYRTGDATSKLFDIAASLVNTVRLLVDEVRKATEHVNGA